MVDNKRFSEVKNVSIKKKCINRNYSMDHSRKIFKSEQSLSRKNQCKKKSSTHVFGILKVEEKQKKYMKKPKQDTQKETTPRHITVNLLKTKNQRDS